MAAFGLFPAPIPVGHEMAGEVVATGEDVEAWAVGDRVIVPFQVSCGACAACDRHHFAACVPHGARAGAAFGFGEAGGGHAGAVADVVLLADNVVDGWRAISPGLAETPGADVLIVGGLAPSIALAAVLTAIGHGAGRVTVADDDPDRLAVAETIGATPLLVEGDWTQRLPEAHVGVENTGIPAGLAAALRATEPYGRCTSVAIHFQSPVPMPLLRMYTKGITFQTSRADARRHLPAVLDDIAAGRLDLDRPPVTVAPLVEADEHWLTPATKLALAADVS